MSKETFYFSHDYNARADRKLVNVIMKHGMAGVGVYWCLVEMLYEEGGYLPTEYQRISFELRIETNVIQGIINDFDLFKTDLDKFWSDAVLERLQERCDKSEKARGSINKRWEKYRNNTNVIRSNEERNTIKERKEEESKVKEIKKYRNIPPLLEEIDFRIKERLITSFTAEAFFAHYNSNGWMVGRNKLKDWDSALTTWNSKKFNNNNNSLKKEFHATDF